MVTTIQINDRTLEILKKVKNDINASSYDEAINKILSSMWKKESMAGFLAKNISRKGILKELRDENDRF